jgi:hypothetical protein
MASSCGSIQIKDAEWCGDMGSEGAYCFHTISNEARGLEKPDWDKERFGMVCTNPANFANWKEAILKLCEQTKNCTYEFVEMLTSFSNKVDFLK